MTLRDSAFVLAIVGFMSLVGNWVGKGNAMLDALPGMLILIVIALAGIAMAKIIPIKLPAVAYVVTIGCIITYPGFPGSDLINGYMKQVNFVALCTPILAYAGIAIGKDIDVLRKAGWRIAVLACFVFTGTYIASAVIAQFILKAIGQI